VTLSPSGSTQRTVVLDVSPWPPCRTCRRSDLVPRLHRVRTDVSALSWGVRVSGGCRHRFVSSDRATPVRRSVSLPCRSGYAGHVGIRVGLVSTDSTSTREIPPANGKLTSLRQRRVRSHADEIKPWRPPPLTRTPPDRADTSSDPVEVGEHVTPATSSTRWPRARPSVTTVPLCRLRMATRSRPATPWGTAPQGGETDGAGASGASSAARRVQVRAA